MSQSNDLFSFLGCLPGTNFLGLCSKSESVVECAEVPSPYEDVKTDTHEFDDRIEMEFVMPGVTRSQLKINIEKICDIRCLVVSTEAEPDAVNVVAGGVVENGKPSWSTLNKKPYRATVPIPNEVGESDITAKFWNGVLYVTAKKHVAPPGPPIVIN